MANIRIPRSWELPERLATPEDIYLSRRQVLRALGLGALAAGLPLPLACSTPPNPDLLARGLSPAVGKKYADRFPAKRNPKYGIGDRKLTPEKDAGGINNFYEFTTTKDEVWKKAIGYPVDPWKIEVSGLVKEPRTLDLYAVMKGFPLEERLYRFRCVERWSMQVPWTGYPLRSLLDSLDPLPSATHVRFVCVNDPEHLPGVKESPWYPWPYHEGLRLDEARNPLAFVVVGSYGHALPMQHGAPLRLALPWKYGYKGLKSIVKIEFMKEQPHTFWNVLQPGEYGFYSNVNPKKPHPRWSQEIETDIGTGGGGPHCSTTGMGIRWRGCIRGRRPERQGEGAEPSLPEVPLALDGHRAALRTPHLSPQAARCFRPATWSPAQHNLIPFQAEINHVTRPHSKPPSNLLGDRNLVLVRQPRGGNDHRGSSSPYRIPRR